LDSTGKKKTLQINEGSQIKNLIRYPTWPNKLKKIYNDLVGKMGIDPFEFLIYALP